MNSKAFSERREQDLRRVQNLAKQSGGKIKVLTTSGTPINRIEIELAYKTAASQKYPDEVSTKTTVQIDLSARYPLQEPSATITTKVFHPNVYSHGKICFGTKWLPSEGLDLLVKRIVQIITFDTSLLNEKSPANSTALKWYQSQKQRTPNAFPTQSVSFSTESKKQPMKWTNISGPKGW